MISVSKATHRTIESLIIWGSKGNSSHSLGLRHNYEEKATEKSRIGPTKGWAREHM